MIPTLNAFDVGDGREVVIIIDGTRVGDVRVNDEEVMQTVIQRWGTGGGNVPAIAYSIREDAIAENFSVNEIKVTNALQAHQPSANSHHAQTFILEGELSNPMAFDLYNQRVTEKNQTLSASASDASHQGAVWEGLVVRRLTPIECERLQGFPDNWTDGQADSSRYKQMGNAVAVPVVNWIIGRMVENG